MGGFLGGRVEDWLRQFLVLAHTLGQARAAKVAGTRRVACPRRCVGDSGEIAAHHGFDRNHGAFARDRDVRVGNRQNVIRHDVLGPLEPPRAHLIENLPFPGNVRDDAVEGRVPVGGDQDEIAVAFIHVAHFPGGFRAEKVEVGFLQNIHWVRVGLRPPF